MSIVYIIEKAKGNVTLTSLFYEDGETALPKDAVVFYNKDDLMREVKIGFIQAINIDKKNLSISYDIDKVKSIKMEQIRKLRLKKLEELDKESMKFLGNTPKINEIQIKKQKYRDLPAKAEKELAKIKDAEEIFDYIPEELRG